ncbi:helical hairpin domain-containing protein [Streptococcus thoraltensis]
MHSESPIDSKIAYQIWEELNISSSVKRKEIEKQVVEFSIERKALKEKFDSIVKDFTQYEKLENHAQARRQETSSQTKAHEEIER